MRFIATADTDAGIVKPINQDSILIKHAQTPRGEVLMAIICDGMGGLSKGELASAHVIRAFDKWFETSLPELAASVTLPEIGADMERLLHRLNAEIMAYLTDPNESMGTTFTGMLFIGEEYVIMHVGDSRAYYIGPSLDLLTKDQTFVAREVERGNMTEEQARTDRRRSILLQCVGASRNMRPDMIYGRTRKGAYMLCSDGFRHEITPAEIFDSLNPINLLNKEAMHNNAKYLITLVKKRRERDNISVILIKTE